MVQSSGTLTPRSEYGWFDDSFDESPFLKHYSSKFSESDDSDWEGSVGKAATVDLPLRRTLSLPPPISEPPPNSVLESRIETQELWYRTAGRRPVQPPVEREYFERLWRQNFERSNVNYAVDVKKIDSVAPENVPPKSEYDGDIIVRGNNPFSSSMAKTFPQHEVGSMLLQIPRFRVLRTKGGAEHAEFLILVTFGVHSKVTLGLWRRFSEFNTLAQALILTELTATRSKQPEDAPESERVSTSYKKAWETVVNRKRWYRCLEIGYLSLKAYLLERFIQYVLIESISPELIVAFLDLK